MKFKEFLKEESVITFIDPFSKEKAIVLKNPCQNDMKNIMRCVMLESGNWFMTVTDTLHDDIAKSINENMPQFSQEIVNKSIYTLMRCEGKNLEVYPILDEVDEEDWDSKKNIIHKCLKGTSYKIVEEE
jgi:hypothetical protein